MNMSLPKSTAIAVLTLAVGLYSAGCDDPPPSTPPPATEAAERPKPQAKPMVNANKAEQELTEKDFIEREDNRDPFRSFISMFKTTRSIIGGDQRKVKMKRYALDELKLIAVVTGVQTRPLAMFRDPAGLGVTVKRGDYISKSLSRIKQILNDKGIVEIEGHAEDEKTRSDRVIDLYAEDTKKR